jgi:hypothetical protein
MHLFKGCIIFILAEGECSLYDFLFKLYNLLMFAVLFMKFHLSEMKILDYQNQLSVLSFLFLS